MGNSVGNVVGNTAGNAAGNLVGNGWGNDAVFSLNTWLRMIYYLQTIHEPACVILTLVQFFYFPYSMSISLTKSEFNTNLFNYYTACHFIL